ncbi:hypothetical protein SteCoe_1396 [Stentor coeruleus]|uniref:RING-type domain-containing protein n=1 Tax=Stentor coeruleus TaxID=5963 RepID=A0A1R2D1R1_9CILI|nr:hypothetical protein SteCoe_1396 [Stentor coeruleus]
MQTFISLCALCIFLVEVKALEWTLTQQDKELILSFEDLGISFFTQYHIILSSMSNETSETLLVAKLNSKPKIIKGPPDLRIDADIYDYNSWVSGSQTHKLILTQGNNWFIGIYITPGIKIWNLTINGINTAECFSSCTFHGNCMHSQCLCDDKWVGIDCSIFIQPIIFNKDYAVTLNHNEYMYFSIQSNYSSLCEFKKQPNNILEVYYKTIGAGISDIVGNRDKAGSCILGHANNFKECLISGKSIFSIYSKKSQSLTIKCPYIKISNSSNPKSSSILMSVLLSVASVIIIVWATVAIIKCIKYRRRKRTHHTFTKIIKNERLPVVTFKDLEKKDIDNCPVCLQKYLENSEVRVLECAHFYHKECIDEWFQNNPFCCICKRSYSSSDYIVNVLPVVEDNTRHLSGLNHIQRDNWVDHK